MFSNRLKFLTALIVISVTIKTKAYSQDKSVPKELYAAAGIPDSLKEGANSVVRYNMEDYDIQGPGISVEKVHSIVTILNEKAKDEATIILPYNKKFSTVSSFEMRIYDADGKLIKKYHKGDLYEHAAVDYESLITDDRIQAITHEVVNYPTTIELIYEIDNNSLIDLGRWIVQYPEQSVQNSSCWITINSDAGFRYLNRNNLVKTQKGHANDKDIYTWEVSNLKAYKLESGAMSWKVIPEVKFASNKFEYYGYQGDFSTWQNFGKWVQTLNNDVCALSSERIQAIQKMTDTIKTDKEKVKFLYKYMQQNMRYINIKLGIGGLKPLPATFVDDKKYGDCKALSNYMRALLKAVNINSYILLLMPGPMRNRLITPFLMMISIILYYVYLLKMTPPGLSVPVVHNHLAVWAHLPKTGLLY
ncbi:MAG: Transglutaminase-like enzyme putative cysteine protease [Mucilaginibacter sp.]|nr:Transglutaminase-like enzyme putative cysteine protease [Mucilaginibacter sp.]